MPEYTLDVFGERSMFIAKDADDARKRITRTLGNEGIDEATLIGPSGQVWSLWHTRNEDGLAGWRYKDASGATSRVYQHLNPKPGTLWAGKWQGIYDINGLYMVAFDSIQFEDEDFALVGAVYYTLYDDKGHDVDGGWFGYNELTTWEDFLDFAGVNPKNVRLIVKESDPRFDDIQEALEAGTYKAASPKSKSPKSKNRAVSANRRKPGKNTPGKRRH